MRLELAVTKKQKAFIDATEQEVLFGGAAGGGKSYGQTVDALLFALRYPGSKQLILRRTFAEQPCDGLEVEWSARILSSVEGVEGIDPACLAENSLYHEFILL